MRHFAESLMEVPITYEFRRRHSLLRPQLKPTQPIEPELRQALRVRHSKRKASRWLDEPERSKVTAFPLAFPVSGRPRATLADANSVDGSGANQGFLLEKSDPGPVQPRSWRDIAREPESP